MAQFGEKDWFRKIRESITSFASHMTQGIDLCITKKGVVRGISWTRQTPSDAWESGVGDF